MTVCPISARQPKYPNEVPIPSGHAGQTKDAVILIHQIRTIDIRRVKDANLAPGGGVAYVTDPGIRNDVREALKHHLGVDRPPELDGAIDRPSWFSEE